MSFNFIKIKCVRESIGFPLLTLLSGDYGTSIIILTLDNGYHSQEACSWYQSTCFGLVKWFIIAEGRGRYDFKKDRRYLVRGGSPIHRRVHLCGGRGSPHSKAEG